MRESWRTLGLYCRRIEYLDWDASCMLRIYDIISLAPFRLIREFTVVVAYSQEITAAAATRLQTETSLSLGKLPIGYST